FSLVRFEEEDGRRLAAVVAEAESPIIQFHSTLVREWARRARRRLGRERGLRLLAGRLSAPKLNWNTLDSPLATSRCDLRSRLTAASGKGAVKSLEFFTTPKLGIAPDHLTSSLLLSFLLALNSTWDWKIPKPKNDR